MDVDNDSSLILAESTGLQSGNVTVAMDRFHPPADSGVTREWLLRTALAVCLPHEMKVGERRSSTTAADLLEKFGYGQPDCKVYRYWEPGQPITTRRQRENAGAATRQKRVAGRRQLRPGRRLHGETSIWPSSVFRRTSPRRTTKPAPPSPAPNRGRSSSPSKSTISR